MTELSQVVEFWQKADGPKWHQPSPKMKPITTQYRTLLDRAIGVLGRPPKSAIDWGVGGGLVADMLTAMGCHVYGVDIVERTGTFESITIDIAEPEKGVEGLSVDLFVCLTVIQHMPNQTYAKRIVRLAADVLVPGGVALFQVRTGKARTDKLYKSRWMSATLFEPEEFWRVVGGVGLGVRYEEHGKDWAKGYYYLIGVR